MTPKKRPLRPLTPIILRLLALLLMLVFAAPRQALAWADGGHKAIGLIAWDQLTEQERTWVEEILRAHPLFQAQFAAPMHAEFGSNPAPADAQRWLFCQAAIWPDLVRPAKNGPSNPAESYHRGTWHYADLPVFPTEAMRKAMASEDVEPNYVWKPGSPDFLELKLNAVQVLKKARHELRDEQIPVERRAVMMCWLFHVLSDVHQPCHSAQLFTPSLLPQGDRGANSITIEGLPHRPLHAYWDNLLGVPGTTYETAGAVAASIKSEPALMTAAVQLQMVLEPEAYLREGQANALLAVYPPAVLEVVAKLDADFATKLAADPMARPKFPVVVRLEPAERAEYEARAARLARERVALAGLRLAQVIKVLSAK